MIFPALKPPLIEDFHGYVSHNQMVTKDNSQWPFQETKLEVPTIYKAYVRGYPRKILPYMVQYLHLSILKFPLKQKESGQVFDVGLKRLENHQL